MNLTASVVIPYYNSPLFLRGLMHALAAQTYPHHLVDVIVVDDGSSEAAAPFFEECRAPLQDFRNLRLIRHPVNRGRACTRNTGARSVQGDIIVFLDVDVMLDPGYLEAIMAVHTRLPHTAIRANIRVAPELTAGSAFLRFRDSRYLGGRRAAELNGLDLDNLPPNFFATCGISVPRADLLAVGLLDEGFTGYGGEDEELGYRLHRAGIRFMLCVPARMWEVDNAITVGRTCARYKDYGQYGAQRLFAKWPEYRRFSSFRWLEPPAWRRDGPLLAIKKIIIRLMLWSWLAHRLIKLLDAVDGRHIPIDPPGLLYQYVLRASYLEGVCARHSRAASQGGDPALC